MTCVRNIILFTRDEVQFAVKSNNSAKICNNRRTNQIWRRKTGVQIFLTKQTNKHGGWNLRAIAVNLFK